MKAAFIQTEKYYPTPVGTKVRQIAARSQDWPGQGHQPGGAIQFEIREQQAKIEWFKKIGNLDDYLK